MNTNTLLAGIVVALAASPVAHAEYAKLTPDWAKQNPGRLTLDTGTAFGGWNDYTFRMHFDAPKLFSLRSQVLLKREDKEGHIGLHSFEFSQERPATVLPIKITTPSFTPPVDSDKQVVASADARVHVLVRHLGPDGKPTGRTDEYDLTLSDFKGVTVLPARDESSADGPDGGRR